MNEPYQRVTNDSVWSGAGIGAAAYGASFGMQEAYMRKKTGKGMWHATSKVHGSKKTAALMAGGTALWAGIGAGIDAMNRPG